MSETPEQRTRREWMQTVGIGSAVAGMGLIEACRSPATKEPQARALVDPTVPLLQVFLHGMMIVELPGSKSDKSTILAHIPEIAFDSGQALSHEYMAGPANLTGIGLVTLMPNVTYALAGVTASTKGTPPGIWANNMHFSSGSPCSVSSDFTKPGNTPQHCVIELPMPDDYLGCNLVAQQSGGPVFSGTTAANCGLSLTSLPLIQVLRYHTFAANATLIVKNQPTNVVWQAAGSNLHLHIYAEPKTKMTGTRNSLHLDKLTDFYNPKLDLSFTNLNGNVITGSNADSGILSLDLSSLAGLYDGSGQGGDVADCVNGYGS